MTALRDKLHSLWEENEGEAVLFIWISFLLDEAFMFLGYDDSINLVQVVNYREDETRQIDGENEEKGESDVVDNNKEDKEREISGKREDAAGVKETDENQCDLNEERIESDMLQGAMGGAGISYSNKGGTNNAHEQTELELLICELIEYNEKQKVVMFENSSFDCEICFSNKKGKECMKFENCEHVFCHECLRGYCHVKIEDGTVNVIRCPAPDCKTNIHPVQVCGRII